MKMENLERLENLKELNGDKGIVAFPNIEKIYSSDNLFAAFVSRLPDKRRKDLNEILEEYDLAEYNEFELLKKSGGRLPIDTLEFVTPIDLERDYIVTNFYIAGFRHYVSEDIYDKTRISYDNINLGIGDFLDIKCEPDNDYDSNAVAIYKNNLELAMCLDTMQKRFAKL